MNARHRLLNVARAGLVLGLAALGSVCVGRPACGADAGGADVIMRGGVRLYPKQRRIEMDGKFCLTEGPIELFACARGGKEYESIISLRVKPSILHLFLVMMKLKPGGPGTGPRFQGDPEHAPSGSPVIVRVRWTDKTGQKTVRAEDLCWNVIDKRPMRRTHWVFVGSRIQTDPETKKRIYWADIEKSIIAVFRDPSAVLDLPLALAANDEAYVVSKGVAPKIGTPCTVILEPGSPVAPHPKNAAGGSILHVDVTAGGRILVGGVESEKLGEALKAHATQAPKDTCRMTVDHGAPAKAAAAAFEAIAGAGMKIESVETTRIKPNVGDAITLELVGDETRVNGKRRSPGDVLQLLRGRKGPGVIIAAGKGVSLEAVIRALRVCEGVKGAVVRVVWRKE